MIQQLWSVEGDPNQKILNLWTSQAFNKLSLSVKMWYSHIIILLFWPSGVGRMDLQRVYVGRETERWEKKRYVPREYNAWETAQFGCDSCEAERFLPLSTTICTLQ